MAGYEITILTISSSSPYIILISFSFHLHLQPISSSTALADKALAIGRPVDNGPQEGDYSAGVGWEEGKVETRKTSQGAQLSRSSRLSSPPPVAHYLHGALA